MPPVPRQAVPQGVVVSILASDFRVSIFLDSDRTGARVRRNSKIMPPLGLSGPPLLEPASKAEAHRQGVLAIAGRAAQRP